MPSFSSKDEEPPEGEAECLVCMDDYNTADSFALPCGHRYCAACWQGYLEVKVDEGNIIPITNIVIL